MSEVRMAEFLSMVPIPGEATFFCTQAYECLSGTAHELGPHPFLGPTNDWGVELEAKRKEFPAANGWRSHSCIFSHLLAQELADAGYQYVSTHDDFGREGIKPHRHSWGVWHMPIYYMDNLDFSAPRFWSGRLHRPFNGRLIDTAVAGNGVYVFDFHPIHLMLNTPSTEFYLKRRDPFIAGKPRRELSYSGYGTASFYGDLCAAMKSSGIESMRMADALRIYLEGSAG
jgi:hypothetical protein